MDAKELAEKLDKQTKLFVESNARLAQSHGLVIVFGCSDDLIEFRGGINDEGDVYDGGVVYVDKNGLLPDTTHDPDDDEYLDTPSRLRLAKPIEAVWCDPLNGFEWSYKTDIPHASFSMFSQGEKKPYCRGIVFSMESLK